ncbi:hypothetical protein GGQ86_001378 [Xanthobacter flavus]|uniref:DUF6998 domain-containing protein n=1 Tax=Xanthobacter flavus TaxID=281 RepID=A0A9W6CK66_XANFL|nr:hypothetical protein [Xanthobacter flavus]MDR6332914.1 hypothetical protein [Xanthobacter flavus]GLI21192.1 hypothetical protein XFLAVUS301_08660 [Xanthobacter flavus]
MTDDAKSQRVAAVLAAIRPLAAEYYRLTGKPLGVTGELGEHAAAELLGLELASARTKGHDALRIGADGTARRVQIKTRVADSKGSGSKKLGTLAHHDHCDTVLLVLLGAATFDPREIWEAPMSALAERLAKPGSKARDRGRLSIGEFKRIGRLVWPSPGE